jgi:peptide/nickel transport system substrate-binding protein
MSFSALAQGLTNQHLGASSGVIVLVYNNYVEAQSKKLARGHIAHNWECDGLKIGEGWWFA